jgi:hypothetical protein
LCQNVSFCEQRFRKQSIGNHAADFDGSPPTRRSPRILKTVPSATQGVVGVSPAHSILSASDAASPDRGTYQKTFQDGLSPASARLPFGAELSSQDAVHREQPASRGARRHDSGQRSHQGHRKGDHANEPVTNDVKSPRRARHSLGNSDTETYDAASPQLHAPANRFGRDRSDNTSLSHLTAVGSAAATPEQPVILQLNVQSDGSVALSGISSSSGRELGKRHPGGYDHTGPSNSSEGASGTGGGWGPGGGGTVLEAPHDSSTDGTTLIDYQVD